MAERIVSPGVFTRENDLSFLAQGVGEIGAAFIGPFKQGPAFIPTIVRTQSEFEDIFGTPDGTYYTEYAVQNYLREAGTATIVRVGGIGGYAQPQPFALRITGSATNTGLDGRIFAVLFATGSNNQETGFTASISASQLSDSSSFVINNAGIMGSSYTLNLLPSSTNDVSDVFGESPFGTKAPYTYAYFENYAATLSGDDYGIQRVTIPTQDFRQDITYASTPWVQSQTGSAQDPASDLFRFHTIGDGTIYNTKYKIGISGVKAAGEDGSTDYSVFSVTVRAFSDSDRRKVVLETFNNVNLDPASPNFIARVIGDRNVTIDSDGKITENGDYSNKSKYIRVEVKEQGTYPISAMPFGHSAYYSPIDDGQNGNLLPGVQYSTGSNDNTTSSTIRFSGLDIESAAYKIDMTQFLKPIPLGVTGRTQANFSFHNSPFNATPTGSGALEMAKRQMILCFQEGFDGLNPIIKPALGTSISAANVQGLDCSTSIASGSVAYAKAIAAVSNPDEYDINMVVTPGIIRRLHSNVTDRVIDMVENRQDAFYIADFNGAGDTIVQATDEASLVDSNYVGTYYPWVKTIDGNTNKLTSVPPSTLLPAVFAANDRLAAEWFAPAGLNRGGITGAVSVLNRLTHSERDTLYEAKVNPIAVFPGQGIVAYGQKTLQDRASALDRINVRRLLITVKKFVASTSRFLVFEQNTSETRTRFLNTVNPYFEAIQQRQGLYAFNVVMDESNNTPDVIDRNIMAGQIFLQPTKTAEFIVIDFNILPTGATFSA
jgi:hypothetical protein